MQEFAIHGPFKLPIKKKIQGRQIDREKLKQFWEETNGLAESIGCYVFGIRSGGGIKPCYIGKATKSFRQECFTHHKLGHYNSALLDCLRGTPVLFFVKRQGLSSSSYIAHVENFLIEFGRYKNSNLFNIKGTKQSDWSIRGVLRSGRGMPSDSAKSFKNMMGL